MRRFVLSCAVAFTAMTAHAQQPQQALSGIGATSCGKFLENRAQREPTAELMYISWAQGFLSGMNWSRRTETPKREMHLLPDHESILAYVDKFCRENPLKPVVSGVSALYMELQ